MAKPRCPIEMEPRTLKQRQLTLAREVAVDMFHKDDKNEVSGVFLQGLKPVCGGIQEVEIVHKAKSIVDSEEMTITRTHGIISETCCQCLDKSSISQISEYREP